MIRHTAFFLALLAVAFTGCDKVKLPFPIKKKAEAVATPVPMLAVATPPPATPPPATPTPAPATPKPEKKPAPPTPPPKPVIDPHSEVVVILYHRLEGKAGGYLSIEPELFEKQMQEIKDAGLTVISMQDYLAYRRGEKNIPKKSVLISIDDGYVSTYDVAWPILKKYGYPFTVFVYLNYINAGGKSITWDQLAEMRDAGVEIGSHTVSHHDLRKKLPKFPGTYEEWLKDELERSKKTIEERLGIRCSVLAYVGGNSNAKIQEAARTAGYEAAFTVYGQRLGMTTNAHTLGRYDVKAKDAQGRDAFSVAISFQGMMAPSAEPVVAQEAAASMITVPMQNEVVSNAKPEMKVNLAALGELDAGSVEMRVSGLGLVPAKFDEESKNVSFTPAEPLKPGPYTVIVQAKSGGQRREVRWNFTYTP